MREVERVRENESGALESQGNRSDDGGVKENVEGTMGIVIPGSASEEVQGVVWLLFQMDSIGFWNVRGINSPKKHGDVRWSLNHHVYGLFGMLETRVKVGNSGKVFPRICSNWSVVTNYSCHQGGRIWLV